jgi:hypothetical protein
MNNIPQMYRLRQRGYFVDAGHLACLLFFIVLATNTRRHVYNMAAMCVVDVESSV